MGSFFWSLRPCNDDTPPSSVINRLYCICNGLRVTRRMWAYFVHLLSERATTAPFYSLFDLQIAFLRVQTTVYQGNCEPLLQTVFVMEMIHIQDNCKSQCYFSFAADFG